MSETPVATAIPEVHESNDETPFESLEESLRDGGPTAAIESLIEHLDKRRRIPGHARRTVAQGSA